MMDRLAFDWLVAEPGTVRLTENMVIERYSHVMHIVSNVSGEAQPGLSAIDALRAALPAGTLSGAPKVRAMEIIDELEPVKRGIYGGLWAIFPGLAIWIQQLLFERR
jgi:anthranilate synthase component 1